MVQMYCTFAWHQFLLILAKSFLEFNQNIHCTISLKRVCKPGFERFQNIFLLCLQKRWLTVRKVHYEIWNVLLVQQKDPLVTMSGQVGCFQPLCTLLFIFIRYCFNRYSYGIDWYKDIDLRERVRGGGEGGIVDRNIVKINCG